MAKADESTKKQQNVSKQAAPTVKPISEWSVEELKDFIHEEIAVAFEQSLPEIQAPSFLGEQDQQANPEELSAQAAGVPGWGTVKRVAKGTWGAATLPYTAVYSAVTGDRSAVGHSAHHLTDAVAGEGTWNRAKSTVMPRSQHTYNYMGIYSGTDKWCGNCGAYIGRSPTPVGAGTCRNCGRWNAG